MAATYDDAAQRAAYWPVPIARAVPLAGLAIAIAFTAEHSPHFGLLAFGTFAVVNAFVLGILAARRLGPSRTRPYFVTQAVVSLVLGIVALAANAGSIGFLFLVATAFAAITGLLELYSGFRTRQRFVASTDWLVIGGLTVIAAIVFLVIPPEYSQSFKDPDGVVRVLDSSVIVVGIIGAYAAIAAVYLVIAGLSAKWGTQANDPAETPDAIPAESESKA
ncbi:hypothetical protein BH09ACT1_BH09ACT1_01390 [soil metagenome]